MKHQTGGIGWLSGNILDFHAGLPEVWGSNPGGEKDEFMMQCGLTKHVVRVHNLMISSSIYRSRIYRRLVIAYGEVNSIAAGRPIDRCNLRFFDVWWPSQCHQSSTSHRRRDLRRQGRRSLLLCEVLRRHQGSTSSLLPVDCR